MIIKILFDIHVGESCLINIIYSELLCPNSQERYKLYK